jgi:hypothetical protein
MYMTSRSRHPLSAKLVGLTTLALVTLGGCAGRMTDTVRKQAASDFSCASEQLTVEPGASGAYQAKGCEREDTYYVSCTMYGITCSARSSAEQHEYEAAKAELAAQRAANPPPASSPPATAAGASAANPPAAQSAAPAAPTVVSVTLRSSCRETVKIFFGDKPKFGSGTYSSLSSNSSTSKQMQPGDLIWLVDDSQNGLSSTSVSGSTREIEVLESCTAFRVR